MYNWKFSLRKVSTNQSKFGERLNTNRLLSPSILGTTWKYKLFWSEKKKGSGKPGRPPSSLIRATWWGFIVRGMWSCKVGSTLLQPRLHMWGERILWEHVNKANFSQGIARASLGDLDFIRVRILGNFLDPQLADRLRNSYKPKAFTGY